MIFLSCPPPIKTWKWKKLPRETWKNRKWRCCGAEALCVSSPCRLANWVPWSQIQHSFKHSLWKHNSSEFGRRQDMDAEHSATWSGQKKKNWTFPSFSPVFVHLWAGKMSLKTFDDEMESRNVVLHLLQPWTISPTRLPLVNKLN